MKQWIKIDIDSMNDKRIMALVEEMGMKGFGAYVYLKMTIERNGGALRLSDLLAQTKRLVRYNFSCDIIRNYSLFEVDESSYVRICVPAGRPTDRPADRPTDRSAHEHISDENKNRKEIVKENNDDMAGAVRAMLMDEGNMPWREAMMMQCGYAALMGRRWSEAVDFFIQHITAQDRLNEVRTEQELRRHFMNFCRLSCPSGKHLHDYLENLSVTETNNEKENALWT